MYNSKNVFDNKYSSLHTSSNEMYIYIDHLVHIYFNKHVLISIHHLVMGKSQCAILYAEYVCILSWMRSVKPHSIRQQADCYL